MDRYEAQQFVGQVNATAMHLLRRAGAGYLALLCSLLSYNALSMNCFGSDFDAVAFSYCPADDFAALFIHIEINIFC